MLIYGLLRKVNLGIHHSINRSVSFSSPYIQPPFWKCAGRKTPHTENGVVPYQCSSNASLFFVQAITSTLCHLPCENQVTTLRARLRETQTQHLSVTAAA